MRTVRWQVGIYPGMEPRRVDTWTEAREALVEGLQALEDPAARGMVQLIPEDGYFFHEHVIEPFFYAYIVPVGPDGRPVRER